MISINGSQNIKVKLSGAVTTNQLSTIGSFTEYSSPKNSEQEITGTIGCHTKDDEYVIILDSNKITTRFRKIEYLSIKNSDTHEATLFIDFFNGTSPVGILEVTLNPGDTLYYEKGNGWRTLDITGSVKTTILSTVINDLTEIVNTFVAGENLGGQRVVMIVAGQAFYYDPTNENNVGRDVGITKGSVIMGANVEVVSKGVMTGFSGSLIQDDIYYVDLLGQLTSVIPVGPGIDMRVGVAIDANTLNINFSEPCILI